MKALTEVRSSKRMNGTDEKGTNDHSNKSLKYFNSSLYFSICETRQSSSAKKNNPKPQH